MAEQYSATGAEVAGELPLTDQVRDFRKRFRKAYRPFDRASKALDGLAEAGGTRRMDILARAVDAIGALPAGSADLADDRAALLDRLQATCSRLVAEARGALLRELKARGLEQGVDPTLVSEQPLSVLLAPVVVELDLTSLAATVTYAREPVLQAEATASKILAARDKAIESIREQAVSSEDFFERVAVAYRMVLAARGREHGERVDLVDLLAPLAILQHDADAWRKDAPDKIAPYPRYLLAYQLNRLRRDGLLVHRGRRLELGTATGGSTRNKRDVLFVPTSPTEGQYHLSWRITAG